jgi:hypothetical protein
MLQESGYTRAEVAAADQAVPPQRGELCRKCGVRIPSFREWDESNRLRVLRLIRNSQSIMAMHELQVGTGCGNLWAKIWVTHSGVPHYLSGPPCPFCSQPLVTDHSQQCDHCLRDWHDPTHVIDLRTRRPTADAPPQHFDLSHETMPR